MNALNLQDKQSHQEIMEQSEKILMKFFGAQNCRIVSYL